MLAYQELVRPERTMRGYHPGRSQDTQIAPDRNERRG